MTKFKILGEVYLDIDYSDVAYISDTGRNWSSNSANLKDTVNTKIETDLSNREQLLNYFRNKSNPKIIFNVHPERWTSNVFSWSLSLVMDEVINLIKVN